jgi:hypothetical protein
VTTAPLALGLLIYKGLSESIVKAFINLTQLVAGYAVATAATKRLFVFWFIALSYAGRETGVWLWFGWVLTLLWIVAGLACTTLLSIPIIWTINFVASVVAEVVPAEPERLDFAIWVGGLQSVVYVCAKYRPICIMVPLGWSKALFICGAKAPPTVEPARWESIGQPMHHSERRSPHEPNPSAGEVGAPARRGQARRISQPNRREDCSRQKRAARKPPCGIDALRATRLVTGPSRNLKQRQDDRWRPPEVMVGAPSFTASSAAACRATSAMLPPPWSRAAFAADCKSSSMRRLAAAAAATPDASWSAQTRA